MIHLESNAAACVEKVSIRDEQAKEIKPTWQILKPSELEIHVPLKVATAGNLKIELANDAGTTAAKD